jgi:hypothetical protein
MTQFPGLKVRYEPKPVELTYRLKNGKVETWTFASVGRAAKVVKALGVSNILAVDGEAMLPADVAVKFEVLIAQVEQVRLERGGYEPPVPTTDKRALSEAGPIAVAEKRLGVEVEYFEDDAGQHIVSAVIHGEEVVGKAKTDKGAVAVLMAKAEMVKNRVAAMRLGL